MKKYRCVLIIFWNNNEYQKSLGLTRLTNKQMTVVVGGGGGGLTSNIYNNKNRVFNKISNNNKVNNIFNKKTLTFQAQKEYVNLNTRLPAWRLFPRVSSRVGIYWGGIVHCHVGNYHNTPSEHSSPQKFEENFFFSMLHFLGCNCSCKKVYLSWGIFFIESL